MDSISEGLSASRPSAIAPSMIYKGAVAPNEPAPRTTIFTSAPAIPPRCKISTPGVRPCRAEATLAVTCFCTSLAETEDTAAVILDFF